jgi:hypothetical protein
MELAFPLASRALLARQTTFVGYDAASIFLYHHPVKRSRAKGRGIAAQDHGETLT